MIKSSKRLLAILLTLMVSMMFMVSIAYAEGKNVAPQAKVTASTSFDDNNAAQNAVDEKKVEHGVGEWASKGEVAPWLKLEWDSPVTINKIVIFDRPNTLDNANGGKITFSDGSTIDVADIDPEGKEAVVTFDAKTVTSLQFDINGAGANVGLAEIQVFDAGEAAASGSDTEANPKTGDAGLFTYLLIAGVAGTGIMMTIRKRK